MISCHDWWPWTKPGYITMTRRQSNNHCSWLHSGSLRPPKNPSVKIRWKSCCLDFLGSRRHPPHWLSSKGPNYQRGVLLISAGAVEGHMKEKRFGKVTKEVLFLHDNALAHRKLATQKKLACLGFHCLDHPTLFSGSGPVGLPPVPWAGKDNLKVSIFLPTRRSLLPRRPGWTDNLPIFFFLVACKS